MDGLLSSGRWEYSVLHVSIAVVSFSGLLGGVCIANGSRTILNSDDWCGVDLLININKVGSPFRILLDLLWCSPHSSFLCSDLAYASAQSSFCSLVVSVAIGFCRNQGLWCLSSPSSNSMWHEIFRPCLAVLQKKIVMESY